MPPNPRALPKSGDLKARRVRRKISACVARFDSTTETTVNQPFRREGMTVWREKFVATGIHFLVTLTLAAVAAALIFVVWFPDPFETMIGGTELFLLVVGCDLALGPLISLVIYDSRKSRRALVFDYAV